MHATSLMDTLAAKITKVWANDYPEIRNEADHEIVFERFLRLDADHRLTVGTRKIPPAESAYRIRLRNEEWGRTVCIAIEKDDLIHLFYFRPTHATTIYGTAVSPMQIYTATASADKVSHIANAMVALTVLTWEDHKRPHPFSGRSRRISLCNRIHEIIQTYVPGRSHG